jgi:hypothetical protein
MKKYVIILALGLLTQFAQAEDSGDAMMEPAVAAEGQGQVVENRQERQEKRIQKGMENGSLTEAEAKKLNAQQARIKRIEKRAQADGTVSVQEKKRLAHAQNNASRDIKRKKHNKRKN